MSTLPRALVLMSALAFGTIAVSSAQEKAVKSPASPVAGAQDKKKDDKKDKKKVGTVEIYTDKGGGFRFRIKSADGKILAQATKGMKAKEDVENVLDEIKEALNSGKPTEVKE